jgi:hypothetical protein
MGTAVVLRRETVAAPVTNALAVGASANAPTVVTVEGAVVVAVAIQRRAAIVDAIQADAVVAKLANLQVVLAVVSSYVVCVVVNREPVSQSMRLKFMLQCQSLLPLKISH